MTNILQLSHSFTSFMLANHLKMELWTLLMCTNYMALQHHRHSCFTTLTFHYIFQKHQVTITEIMQVLYWAANLSSELQTLKKGMKNIYYFEAFNFTCCTLISKLKYWQISQRGINNQDFFNHWRHLKNTDYVFYVWNIYVLKI